MTLARNPFLRIASADPSSYWVQAALALLGGMVSVWIVLRLQNADFGIIGLGLAALVVAAACIWYLGRGVSYERAFTLMILTLPLTSALIIDIGGSIRLSYLFAILAAWMVLRRGGFAGVTDTIPVYFLYAYIIYALISISYTMAVPSLEALTSVGFRGSVFRSVIQFCQLLLMALVFLVTVHFATSLERIHRICQIIFWATALTAVYGFYEVIAHSFDLPYINLINTPYDAEEGNISLERRLAEDVFAGSRREILGVAIPRPRSFFGEAGLLTAYLVFAIPCSLLFAANATATWVRRWRFLGCYTFALLFFMTNARAGFIALAGMLVVALVWAPQRGIRKGVLVSIVVVIAILSFIVLPLIAAVGGLTAFVDFAVSMYELTVNLEGRQGAADESLDVFFRSPVFGVGIGNYIFYVDRGEHIRGAMVGSAANLYLNVASELGIIGFTLFIGFVASIVLWLIRITRLSVNPRLQQAAFTVLAAVVGVMLCRVGSSSLYTDSFMWVLWAMGVAVIRLHGSKTSRFPHLRDTTCL